jgi:4a-hydroxytetrahydrobiopterin dehydratase
MMKKLNDMEIQEQIKILDGWTLESGKLHWEHSFKNFIEAFSFMTSLALHAEKINHHPELFNLWSKVKIDLMTHDCEGISDLDFQLAKIVNQIMGK